MDWLDWVGLLSAIIANNEDVITPALNPRNVGFVKVIKGPPDVRA